MGIQAFPAALQPIIQQNFLNRQFLRGLESILAFRQICDREDFPNKIGETVTKTRAGLKAPIETPITAASNTGLDNGLTSSGYSVEQYTLGIGLYGDTIDLNMVTQGVGIASQFVQNAYVNGRQAAQSLDRLARKTLYAGYLGGNTHVTATLAAPGTTIAVDNIVGFQYIIDNGVPTAVSATKTMACLVNGTAYTLVAATADVTNVSSLIAHGGISGTLTFSANVSVANGTVYKEVRSGVAPLIVRTGAAGVRRATKEALVSNSDLLTMRWINRAVAYLRDNNVPGVGESGAYNCYLDNDHVQQLYQDSEFQNAYHGQYKTKEYEDAKVEALLGVRFLPTTEAPQETRASDSMAIKRAIVCGQGAIIEGDYKNIAHSDIAGNNALIEMINGIAMVTREPLDRLQQIIAQSWYWIGGFALPSDMTANTTIIPTGTNSYLRRAVILESASQPLYQ